jgi:hypothetical protein
MKDVSRRRHPQLSLFTVVITNLGVHIWFIVIIRRHDSRPTILERYTGTTRGMIACICHTSSSRLQVRCRSLTCTGYSLRSRSMLKVSPEWLRSTFARLTFIASVRNEAAFRCLEAIGQAISYGMHTQIKTSPLIRTCVKFGLMAVSVGPTLVLVNSTPDQIPADVIAGEQAQVKSKIGEFSVETKV